MRIAAWVGVATTVAVLTAGAIFGLAAQSRADEITRRETFVDNNGQPLSPPEGYNFNYRLGIMQGIIVVPNGDVWALDFGKDQVVYIPKGDPARARSSVNRLMAIRRTTPAS